METFLAFEESEQSKIFPNAALGYQKLTVERPLRLRGLDPERAYTPKELKALRATAERDEAAPPVIRKVHNSGKVEQDPLRGLFAATVGGHACVVEYEPDPELRDTEQVPLLEPGGIDAFLRREVLPHAADAWYDPASVRVGYEISFTRYFYKPQPLRTLEEIRAIWRTAVARLQSSTLRPTCTTSSHGRPGCAARGRLACRTPVPSTRSSAPASATWTRLTGLLSPQRTGALPTS